MKRPIEERFWEMVSKDCWPYMGSCKPYNGYGHFRDGQKDYNAHRLAWELTYGPIPEGKHVLHKCDVPCCCNPSHLFLGDPAINAADKMKKGRSARGERNEKAKLTEVQVREIRRDYRRFQQGCKKSNLDELFDRYKHTGITRAGVYQAAIGNSWAHVK